VVDTHLLCRYYRAMSSLKAFLPRVAEYVGMSSAALYERQRALVRCGILKGKEGWGPGSGVKLSADALAALLASLMVTDNLSEVDDRVRLLLEAPPTEGTKTKAKTFGDALSIILSSPDTQSWKIEVERSGLTAGIRKGKKSTFFASAKSVGSYIFKGDWESGPLIPPSGADWVMSQPIVVTARLHPPNLSLVIDEFKSAMGNQESSGKTLW
jgi:hypothetical protein